MDKHKVLTNCQFGFRAQYSTTHALLLIVDKIKKAIEKGHFSVGIFRDLQKAFDSVNHGILLRKLNHYGIREISHSWFSSYLSNRKQYTTLYNVTSDYVNVSYGVPQGSFLGPLLFLLYVNDLPSWSAILGFHLFADDTNLCYSNKSLLSLEKIVNDELLKINTWTSSNKLALNVEKSNFVIFHPPQKRYQ